MKYLLILIISISFSGCMRTCNEAEEVAFEQVGPRALLKKYEWFKNVASILDEKRSTIEVLKKRQVDLKDSYESLPRYKWHRSDLESWNLWTTEVSGAMASYNSLAAEYNAQMSKINWRFTNVGDLPAGAIHPLPREYKEYLR